MKKLLLDAEMERFWEKAERLEKERGKYIEIKEEGDLEGIFFPDLLIMLFQSFIVFDINTFVDKLHRICEYGRMGEIKNVFFAVGA